MGRCAMFMDWKNQCCMDVSSSQIGHSFDTISTKLLLGLLFFFLTVIDNQIL